MSSDPTLVTNERVIYENTICVEIRTHENNEGQIHQLNIRISQTGDGSNPHAIKIQIHSEQDIFFLFCGEITPEHFDEMRKRQQLRIEYHQFSDILINLFNKCVSMPHNHVCVLQLKEGGSMISMFNLMQHKLVDLLNFNLQRASNDRIRNFISYRYTKLKLCVANLKSITTTKIKNSVCI